MRGYSAFAIDQESPGVAALRAAPPPIAWVQASLNRVLGTRLAVDGIGGAQTREAIRRFQSRQRLPVDGVITAALVRALIAAGAAPPTPNGGPGAAPRVVKRESVPSGTTLYVDIPLGAESPARSLTGIYLPSGFRSGARVDVILYLHGFKLGNPGIAIDAYWDVRRFPYFALREGVLESGKNLVLVAPTLGPRSQAGRLTAPGGLDAYVDRVRAALAASGAGGGAQGPALGHLILACHSGGGRPMRMLARSSGRYAAHIKECWGFDCLYNSDDAQQWVEWARARPDGRLFVHYLGSTTRLSKWLEARRLPNVVVDRSVARGHNWVPSTHWKNRIATARFLTERGNP